MKVEDVLKEIEEGNKKLELSFDNLVPNDSVILGAVGESGMERREFAFRNEEKKHFLEGLAKIINNKNIL